MEYTREELMVISNCKNTACEECPMENHKNGCRNSDIADFALKIMERETIEDLIKRELKAIIEKHGNFKNYHEMVSVLQEEIEEMYESTEKAQDLREWVWNNIRGNREQEIPVNLKRIENATRETINEAIQVIAVIKKAQQGYK